MQPDNFFMNQALNLAKNALSRGDVPVGAIIVKNNEILSSGSDKKFLDPTEHAEIIAIRSCCENLQKWNLSGCTMYVTLEPCQMCAGAIVQSRLKRLVIGTRSKKSGSCGSIINILDNNEFNHKVKVDFLDDRNSESIIKDFFKGIRAK